MEFIDWKKMIFYFKWSTGLIHQFGKLGRANNIFKTHQEVGGLDPTV